jgi:hypothetical protein
MQKEVKGEKAGKDLFNRGMSGRWKGSISAHLQGTDTSFRFKQRRTEAKAVLVKVYSG